MKICLVAVGKVKERGLRSALDDYLGRVRRYVRLEEVELKELPAAQMIERFERCIDHRGITIAMEVGGETWSSDQLADEVRRCQLSSVPTLTFLVGGSFGLPPEISGRADHRFSLGRITLPHRLARVVLAEQIYRAFTIVRGEPYSH